MIKTFFYYYLNQQEIQPDNEEYAKQYDDLDYEYIEKLKKERAIVVKNQRIFEKKKDKINFLRFKSDKNILTIKIPSIKNSRKCKYLSYFHS